MPTNNSNLSPQAAANLEAHRKRDGKFGAHANTNPEAALPAAPVTVTLVRQLWQWDGESDDLITVGSEEIEVRQILDAMDLDEIIDEDEEAGGHFDHDNIYFAAEKLGLIKPHDGPFEVQLNGSALDYVTARREASQEEAVSTREPLMALDKVNETLDSYIRVRVDMSKAEFEAGRAGVAQVILKRFPTATGATVYDSSNDDREMQLEVATITGADGGSCWERDEKRSCEFTDELLDYSTYLDRGTVVDVLRDGIKF